MKYRIAIIGLGYVGINLAYEFGKKFITIGFDINKERIQELKKYIDRNKEFNKSDLLKAKKLSFSSNINSIKDCNIFIITVPTPIHKNNKPNLSNLKLATKLVSKYIKKNNVIIYESTVFPGCTEEICVPIIEKNTKLKFIKDFNCAYSPERINPGDSVNQFKNIYKIIGASSPKSLSTSYNLYRSILKKKIIKVSSIKVAEAAKVIENVQRDLNIALVNELSLIFQKMNLDTEEVLNAAATKWNFVKYKPGLVGGHCIGVDPYYLTYKSKLLGYIPNVILAGRKMNEYMPKNVLNILLSEIKNQHMNSNNCKLLIAGYTFKENCADIRNTKVKNLVNLCKLKFKKIDIYDPIAYLDHKINNKYNFVDIDKIKTKYDVIIIAVNHKLFIQNGIDIFLSLVKKKHLILDLKRTFPKYKHSIKI